MSELLSIVTPVHLATPRNYLARMNDGKVECMEKAQQYGFDYWDGDRRFGYGGHEYIPGWWKPVAQALIERYALTNNSSVLDIGCGKGYLLYEILLMLPGIRVTGIDISKYGLENSKPEIREFLFEQKAEENIRFASKSFDLVISLGCLHNLRLPDIKVSISEIQRVGKRAYIMVESYRNNRELFNLECWALTAKTFLDVEDWCWLYNYFGYDGDYEFIFFE